MRRLMKMIFQGNWLSLRPEGTELFDLRKELGITEEWLYILTKVEEDKLLWHTFDPLSKKWQWLPPVPPVAKGEEPRKLLAGVADVKRNWLGRRDPLDRLPYCGCAIAC
ncbi:hypothetical protein IFM89_005285 [Coptis chinensis]|uniref:Uncharacterized protein n=1 Tax=Coptis chinensis TaxID=261450 RepID=A0A835IV65_9MAGN|nr:hypothetical protein IFM89_005285 [Coptis chinensis]